MAKGKLAQNDSYWEKVSLKLCLIAKKQKVKYKI